MSVAKTGDDTLVQTEGSLRVDIERIRKITLDNIIRVKNYVITTTADFITHSIEFVNGGTARIGYSTSGKLMEFKVSGVAVAVVGGDCIVLDAE
jgi:hypothetical protein